MTIRRTATILCFVLALLVPVLVGAQLEPVAEDRGATGLELALRRLAASATFLHTTAHPDDEDNGLLVLMSRGRGIRTGLLTTTRGDGGQNEIGPELFEALGILRTEELMAMHRYDRAEQYFTLAYEFGYSFSVEETLEKWGKEETLGDIVRIIRTFRPDVVVSLPLEGEGGGQHHQTSARLTKEAFRAAADPSRFPEQIEMGLRPWQPLKLYQRIWFQRRGEPDPPGTVVMGTGRYDPVLGRSFFQMGMEGRSMHRCQGMPQLRALPGERASKWVLVDAAIPVAEREVDLFDGIPYGLDRLRLFVRDEADAGFVHEALDDLERQIGDALAAFDPRIPWRTLPPLRAGLATVRRLRAEVAGSKLGEQTRYELEHRLAYKEQRFAEAIALAHGLAIDPIADRGEVTRGDRFGVRIQVTNRSPVPVELGAVDLVLPDGWSAERREDEATDGGGDAGPLRSNDVAVVSYTVRVADDADFSRPYWVRSPGKDRYELLRPEHFGLPWSPPPVVARVGFRSGGLDVELREPVQYRYEGPWVGTEKQKEVSVLPAVSVLLEPDVVVFPTRATNRTRTVTVRTLYKGSDPAEGVVRLEPPVGWSVEPAEAPVRFERFDDAASLRFAVTPPPDVETGSFPLRAVARLGERTFREGYETIAYHHIQTRYFFRPAEAALEPLDVAIAPVTVGYIMGVGDRVPEAIRQLGAELVFIDEATLAEGDLDRFDVIVTGVRAYLNRRDLRAYNDRLLRYVENGGTLIVQYNKFEWDDAQWGPYPAKMSRDRVSVEEAPIRILEPDHPVFHFPNEITERDWEGWVQERGLYFLGERDERYRDLVASEDPWEYNAGEKRGMLVEARYGKGRWLYVGLGFFRQLPAGVPGAYKVWANLLSLPKAPE